VQPVAVRILHPEAPAGAGDLERWLAGARERNAERLWSLFDAAAADDIRIVRGPSDRTSFGARLRSIAGELDAGGLVILGSGALPLATERDARAFVEAAGSGAAVALANNRYSADAVAVGRVAPLRDVPDLTGDNALPRWLDEVAGFRVSDLRRHWRLAMDLDSPLDVVLSGAVHGLAEAELAPLRRAVEAVREVAGDRRRELVLAGRTNAGTLRWLERSTAARVRALVEERGLRASAVEAMAAAPAGPRAGRTPRSILGMALDARGPEALGSILGELGDAAILDSRVLLAHRLGSDEDAWPGAEDRFASDLLLPERIKEPWLRALTTAALAAPVPVLLGGHSLVGPGVRLALGTRRRTVA
jgi:hypothetical protein